jgi:hypothetical protein
LIGGDPDPGGDGHALFGAGCAVFRGVLTVYFSFTALSTVLTAIGFAAATAIATAIDLWLLLDRCKQLPVRLLGLLVFALPDVIGAPVASGVSFVHCAWFNRRTARRSGYADGR